MLPDQLIPHGRRKTGGNRAGRTILAATLLAVAVFSRPAAAVVSQPTGEIMPNPAPAGEKTVVTSRGFLDDTVTLEGLFHYRMEMLDPIQSASTMPGTFSPKCEFTGQLVLRGGVCRVGFGWYNVTPGSTTAPAANEIYELVPAQLPRCPAVIDPAAACCDDSDFCPLASPITTQAPQHRWNAPAFRAANIRSDPRYKGGLIGFAMIGGTDCNETKFSQPELNTKSPAGPPTNGAPWVTVLIYQSTVDPNGYYIAFEDRAANTMTWKGDGLRNDGDFNDFVYFVTGVNCEGGGKSCDTKLPGVCATGTTHCSNGTVITCKPDVPSSPEVCDGLDNDCDGVVDQGNPCPDAGQICDRGSCVRKCNDTEFPCAPGLQCDQGYCKDPLCLTKSCPVGQVCVGGNCQGGCDGVVCPQSQVCRLGRCIDPCAGVTCTEGVCENGACVAACSCRGCSNGQACKLDGRCVDPGCDKMDCGPGLVCVKGGCMDPCYGATRCPVGQSCSMGQCMDGPKGTGGFVGTRFDAGAPSGGSAGEQGTGGRPGTSNPDGGGTAATGNGVKKCGCEVGGPSAGLLSSLSLLLAALIASRRARR